MTTGQDAPSGKIDMQELMERVDGSMESLADLVHIFFEELPQYRSGIAAAIAAGDAPALRHAAHSLKSMLGILAAHAAQDLAFSLEKMGASADLDSAPQVQARLEQELEVLHPVLKAFLPPSDA